MMKFFFSSLFGKKPTHKEDEYAVTVRDESVHNITDGSEFLDDAIRMTDQPFMYLHTEESISSGSPKDLW